MSRDEQRSTSVSRRVMRGFMPERFVALRIAAGLSRPELARRAKIGHATVYQWETGRNSPQVNLLSQAVEALGKQMSDVVDIPPEDRHPGDWRVLRGMLQPSLGKLANVSTSTIAQVERGQTELSDNVAARLAAALNISVEIYQQSFERVRNREPGKQP